MERAGSGRTVLGNASERSVRSWLSALLLSALAVGCGDAAVEGVLPSDTPPGAVVALTADGGGGLLRAHPHALFRSRDGGRTWARVAIPPAAARGRITAVAVPRPSPGVVYLAGPGIGITRSGDGGRTWRAAGSGLPSAEVLAFAPHATQPRTLYAIVRAEGLYRTEDGGAHWTRMEAGPGPAARQLVHSDMAGSMQTGWLFAALPTKVRRSMDCFCGWRDAGALSSVGAAPGAPPEVFGITYDPRLPDQVYASAAAGVFHSADGGATWGLASAGGPPKMALAIERVSGALYAGLADGGVMRSTDGGRSWERPDGPR